ncbi:hypothetical protein D0868_00245 [Hortaea werneckii]|uniref:Uncharacterized protein n=1 Tax=Hortaea werneckii TaxID=91943 RepID=A0A3M6ZN89_HORWE|nr:hypothetical protein D0868_00245 [Hortaea werneckii]
MSSLRGASSSGGDDSWSTAPSTPLTISHGSTPQLSDSDLDPEPGEESPISSTLPSSEQITPSHRYPKRAFRSHTVEREVDSIVDKFGRRVKLQWATKPFPTKFIKQRANGEEYVTVDGQDYTIANRSPISEDSDGNIVCRVNFVDSWVPEGNLDPPQLIDSSPVSSHGTAGNCLPSGPSSPQGPTLRPRLRGQLRRPTRAAWIKRAQLPKRPQHSTVRASSALTWSDLNLAHIDDLREHATSDTADYGPAIHQKIQDAVKRGLYDTTTGILTAVLDRGFRAAKLLPRASTYTVRSLAESITPSDSDEDRPSSPALRSLPRSRSIPTDPGLGLNDDDFIRDFNQRLRSQDDEEADEFVMSGGLNGLDGIEFRDGGAESNRKHDQGIIYDPAPDDSDHDSSDDEDPDDGKDAHDSSGDAIEEVRQSHHKRQREPIVIDSSDESSDDLSDEEDVDLYKRLRDLFRMKPSNDPSGDSTDSENESTPKRRRLTPARDQGDIGNSNGRAYRARSRTATSLTAVPEASNAAQQLQGTRTLSNHNQQFTSTRPITSFVYADMVFRGHKFTRGEITQGQLDFLRTRSFDKDAIDWVGNEWRHAMHEREKELRTEALDFYKADGRRFLNKYLVPRSALHLYNPSHTAADLCNALLLAGDLYHKAMRSVLDAIEIAKAQHADRIDTTPYANVRAWTAVPTDTMEPEDYMGENSEEDLFAWSWSTDAEGGKKLRRTIVAMCKLRARIERDDRALRYDFLEAQGG